MHLQKAYLLLSLIIITAVTRSDGVPFQYEVNQFNDPNVQFPCPFGLSIFFVYSYFSDSVFEKIVFTKGKKIVLIYICFLLW